tara:strand:- start:89 stop:658 length:570 start_codon:yes stop_codon:yes gene_type:complete
MPVSLKYTICQLDCKSINFRELTGAYNASTNTTGWGTPNEATTAATAATLIFKSPSGVEYSAVDVNTSLGFPTVDTCTAETILATSVDSSLTEFEDGFWNITYTVTTGTTTYTETKTFFLYSKIKAAITKLVADIDLSDCNCDPGASDKAVQMHTYLLALQYAVGIGDTTSATEIYKTLKNLIDCTTCN